MDSMWAVLFAIGVSLLIFLICREIVCWYFKLNAMIELLTEIRDSQKWK